MTWKSRSAVPVGLLALMLAAIVALEVSDSSAAAAAQAFCASIVLGASAESLEQDARAAGAHLPRTGWYKDPESESEILMVRFSGLDPLDGHICLVRVVGGTIVDREVMPLDL